MPPPPTRPGVIVALAESLQPAESPLRQMIWLLRSTLAGQSLVSLSPDALNGATDLESTRPRHRRGLPTRIATPLGAQFSVRCSPCPTPTLHSFPTPPRASPPPHLRAPHHLGIPLRPRPRRERLGQDFPAGRLARPPRHQQVVRE